jgi:hypothetical protein
MMTIVRRQDLKMTFLMMKRIGMMMKMKRYLKKKKKKVMAMATPQMITFLWILAMKMGKVKD